MDDLLPRERLLVSDVFDINLFISLNCTISKGLALYQSTNSRFSLRRLVNLVGRVSRLLLRRRMWRMVAAGTESPSYLDRNVDRRIGPSLVLFLAWTTRSSTSGGVRRGRLRGAFDQSRKSPSRCLRRIS